MPDINVKFKAITCHLGMVPIWFDVGLSALKPLLMLNASKSKLRLPLEMLCVSAAAAAVAMLLVDDDDQLFVGRK